MGTAHSVKWAKEEIAQMLDDRKNRKALDVLDDMAEFNKKAGGSAI